MRAAEYQASFLAPCPPESLEMGFVGGSRIFHGELVYTVVLAAEFVVRDQDGKTDQKGVHLPPFGNDFLAQMLDL